MDACSYPLSYEYSKYLYYSSFLIGASSFVSLYYKDYVTFLFMFMLWLTSINYWYKPDFGIRRDIDMYLCKIVNFYFFAMTLSVYEEYHNQVFINLFYNAFFLFLIELLFYHYKKKQWIVLHMALHFQVAIFVPFVLYIL